MTKITNALPNKSKLILINKNFAKKVSKYQLITPYQTEFDGQTVNFQCTQAVNYYTGEGAGLTYLQVFC